MEHPSITSRQRKRRRNSVALLLLIGAAVCWTPAPVAYSSEPPLILGIFPRHRATDTTTMYSPLAAHLSQQLRRKVVLVTARDFDAFSIAVQEGRYDIVLYNQYQYIQSEKIYRVIGHNQEFGKSAVAGALYVRKDSGITEVSQLRGRTILFGGGKDAMLSYIAPRFLLLQAGLNEDDFRSEFSLNPPNALVGLFLKQADAAGGGEILLDLAAVKKAIDPQELRILAATEPLLFLPWAVKRTMSARLRESIQSIMVDLGNSEAGRAVLKAAASTGIGKAEEKDYDPHRRIINTVFGRGGTPRK
jgi:phosphonate transport system substrate-binding protein